MTPAARIEAAIEILDALNGTALPADRFVRAWFAKRRYAGSKDRAAVSEHVYDMLRHRASYAWRMGGDAPRCLAMAALLAGGKTAAEIEALFSAGAYGPKPLSDAERAALAVPPSGLPPLHVACECPEWLLPELTRSLGSRMREEMRALTARAPVDLRVNSLRATRDKVLGGLKALGLDAEPTPHAPFGIRVPSASGLNALSQSQLFKDGAFEFQDEASQIAALLCGVKAGDKVLDLAAGGGGKSLALAALMRNEGEVIAADANPERLKDISPRATRAGATIIKIMERMGDLASQPFFDVILVDAPCSGSGAWRRNPENKWRLSLERLNELTAIQSQMLDDAARVTKKGGRLVYATCSLLGVENEDVVQAFLNRNPDFRVLPAAEAWRETIGQPPHFVTGNFRGSPLTSGTDGFFVCIIQRR